MSLFQVPRDNAAVFIAPVISIDVMLASTAAFHWFSKSAALGSRPDVARKEFCMTAIIVSSIASGVAVEAKDANAAGVPFAVTPNLLRRPFAATSRIIACLAGWIAVFPALNAFSRPAKPTD